MVVLTDVESKVVKAIYKGKYYKAKKGWYYDIKDEMQQDNILKVIKLYRKQFAGAWYVVFCTDKVLVIKHKINNVNTEMMMNDMERDLPNEISIEESKIR